MSKKEVLTTNSNDVKLITRKFLKWNGKYYKQIVYTKDQFEKEMNQEPPLLNLDGTMVTGIEFE